MPTLETRVLDSEVAIQTAILTADDFGPHLASALRTDGVHREAMKMPDAPIERRERLGIVTGNQPIWWERVLAVRATACRTADGELFVAVRPNQERPTLPARAAGIDWYEIRNHFGTDRYRCGIPQNACYPNNKHGLFEGEDGRGAFSPYLPRSRVLLGFES